MSLTDVICNILVKGVDGTEYGYISPVLNADGFYANFQPTKAGALAVSFSYSATVCSRLNLKVSNGPSAFPFLGGIVLGNARSAIRRSGSTSIPLGQTCTTPPSGAPRVSSSDNSSSALASADKRESRYLESSIWRYNPATQALTAQWINPEGDEPETIIVLAEHDSYYPRQRLALTGDVDRMQEFTGEDGSVAVVTFTCVPIASDVTCNILVRGADGTEYGYISPVLNADGFYANFQPAQAGALAVSFSYSATACSRLNLKVSNGPSDFPFLGGIVLGNARSAIRRSGYTSIPLGQTCTTPPSGAPRVSSSDNSSSALPSVDKRESRYLESSIWRYNPATQALTAQWINPEGDEPETIIVLAEHDSYYPRQRLALTGDIDRIQEFTGEDGSVAVVTFKCVPILPDFTCNILVRGADGTEHGYISPVLNADGFYANFQPTQAGALAVSFPYSATACSRLNLKVSNGPSDFPFFGGIVLGNENLVLHRPHYTTVPLGQTCATPPSGTPRVFSDKNSHSAVTPAGKRQPWYLESSIWCYNPATQALTAQWINPQNGDEPETTIVLYENIVYNMRRSLSLTGDVEGARNFIGTQGLVAVVTFTCVPTQTV
ncbi:hypothetical protein MSAN_01695300 [Mycena sanguinolenta]|uniref:Uncharacterized protein n=1 Tax=Mycena sanguinolenta TaxID=230812 RepID=A0A8H6Y0S1_9AGAR|nr:hypothetical protein MSAN_01695300 [Mycena sanguinolenta]